MLQVIFTESAAFVLFILAVLCKFRKMSRPGLGAQLDDLEDDFLNWITEEEKLDEEVFEELKQEYIKLGWLREERAKIIKRMAEGGRSRRRSQRTNAEHHQRIKDDFFGTKETTIDGVLHAEVPAWQSLAHFIRRFRMGPTLFSRLLLEIQHPETGYP